MLIEAELKARVDDPDAVRAVLAAAAGDPEHCTYTDVYLDCAGQLAAEGRELRVRTIATQSSVRSIVTYKGPVVDAASGSKPEVETGIDDPEAMRAVLAGLGYRPVVDVVKTCENYRISTPSGRPVLATVAVVPLAGGVFLEVETLVEAAQVPAALDDLRALLLDLEVGPEAWTTALYTDAVIARRAAR